MNWAGLVAKGLVAVGASVQVIGKKQEVVAEVQPNFTVRHDDVTYQRPSQVWSKYFPKVSDNLCANLCVQK